MTTSESGTVGPSSPSPGAAGLLRDGWRPLRAGDDVRCCGGWVDRRAEIRGVERRREPRPCGWLMARIGAEFPAAWVREVGVGQLASPPNVIHLQCARKHCHRRYHLLILTAAVSEAA